MHYLAGSVGTYLGRAEVLEIIMQSRLWARRHKILRELVEFLDIMLHRATTGISKDMELRTPVTGRYIGTKHNMQVISS